METTVPKELFLVIFSFVRIVQSTKFFSFPFESSVTSGLFAKIGIDGFQNVEHFGPSVSWKT
jgi:hypothetical protein